MITINESIIDIGDGWVHRNDIKNINMDIPLEKQKEYLVENILSIVFDKGQYIIDIGWYPAYDPNGSFKIVLIENQNWDIPLYDQNESNILNLHNHIKKCTNIVSIKTKEFTMYPGINPELQIEKDTFF